jgi:hypothetical protein
LWPIFFNCLIHFGQRATDARQLVPAAITPIKAFGDGVEHPLKLDFQALELQPQDRFCDFRQGCLRETSSLARVISRCGARPKTPILAVVPCKALIPVKPASSSALMMDISANLEHF